MIKLIFHKTGSWLSNVNICCFSWSRICIFWGFGLLVRQNKTFVRCVMTTLWPLGCFDGHMSSLCLLDEGCLEKKFIAPSPSTTYTLKMESYSDIKLFINVTQHYFACAPSLHLA